MDEGQGLTVKRYQLFCLDDRDNIVRSEDFEADNDAEATAKGAIHCGEHWVELWADNHRVSRFRPSAHAPPFRRR